MLKKTSQNSKKGTTLVEVIVYIGILGVIVGILGAFQKDIFFLNNVIQSNLGAQLDSRRVVKSIIAELREALPSSLGAYPIAQTGTSTITFFSDVDSDTLKEQVRYYLANKILYRGVIKPTGNPLAYNAGSEIITTSVSDVINSSTTPIFEYYDTNYTGTGTPLSYPINIPSVRLVKVNVIIDKNPNRSPTPLSATSQVSIRNLKDNL